MSRKGRFIEKQMNFDSLICSESLFFHAENITFELKVTMFVMPFCWAFVRIIGKHRMTRMTLWCKVQNTKIRFFRSGNEMKKSWETGKKNWKPFPVIMKTERKRNSPKKIACKVPSLRNKLKISKARSTHVEN